MKTDMRRLIFLGIWLAVASTLLTVSAAIHSTFIAESTMHRIQIRMTEQEVRSIAGEPHGTELGTSWLYRVWGYSDMAVVEFGEDRRVKLVSF